MNARADQPKTPESKSGPKPAPKDDLKTLPLADVEHKLGSSPEGLSQAERRNVWPNMDRTRLKKRKPIRF